MHRIVKRTYVTLNYYIYAVSVLAVLILVKFFVDRQLYPIYDSPFIVSR